MTSIIYLAIGITAAFGIGVAIWSFFDTRKKHYDEYVNRKTND